MNAFIYSIQIGKVKKLQGWETGSFKDEVLEAFVKETGLEGDEVADVKNHGGFEKAVFANSLKNYPKWSEFLGIKSLPDAALGENLTIKGLDETNVFLGDIHFIGEVILQVAQPRKPCWKISKKYENKHFTKYIYDTGTTGWYYKVLKEGNIKKGDSISILSRQKSNMLYQKVTTDKISVKEANDAFRDPKENGVRLKKILTLEGISQSYKQSIKKRLNDEYDLGFMELQDGA